MEKPLQNIDFLAIGDIVADTFIQLQDATVSCDIDNEHCTISMRFGDKIPYHDATMVAGVGNSPNAAVAAARIGLQSSIVCTTGDDELGAECIKSLQQNNVATDLVATALGKKTNHHYVLHYGPERTILVKSEPYDYHLPNIGSPSWIYLSSVGTGSESLHHDLVTYLSSHPEIQLAFQPGTFQMNMGTDALRDVYAHTEIFFCNKEESQRILKTESHDYQELHAGIRNLGPKLVVITDGPNGLTASDESGAGYSLPMYPDPKPPIDRTGAGDACSSTIVAAMQAGVSFLDALRWGPINSMSVVQYIGAQEGLLSREKISELLANAPENYKLSKIF